MPFRFAPTAVPEVVLIEPAAFDDDRGFFAVTYQGSEYAANGITGAFVQDNWSHSVRGVLRGLHYQTHPCAQDKLVMAVTGSIFDVAVDVRNGSPTYARWVGTELSHDNRRMVYVPAGFAHGFCVLSDEADVVYKVTAEYAPEHDGGIAWNDPDIAIDWPVERPILSTKDSGLPFLRQARHNFVYGGATE